jgi:hypothetical protein
MTDRHSHFGLSRNTRTKPIGSSTDHVRCSRTEQRWTRFWAASTCRQSNRAPPCIRSCQATTKVTCCGSSLWCPRRASFAVWPFLLQEGAFGGWPFNCCRNHRLAALRYLQDSAERPNNGISNSGPHKRRAAKGAVSSFRSRPTASGAIW